MIEELKSKHEIEMEKLNSVAKQNAAHYASQELIQIDADYQQKFEKANEIITLKNNTVKIYYICLFCIYVNNLHIY
jgi:transposase